MELVFQDQSIPSGRSAMSGINVQVDTEAQLSLVDVTNLNDSTPAWIGNPVGGVGQSENAPWQLITQVGGLPALASHEVIASNTAGRVWQRIIAVASPRWMQQAPWFVDEANTSGVADDQNTGLTNVTPLATWAEFRRRTLYVNQALTVTVMSNVAGELMWEPVPLQSTAGGTFLHTIQGTTSLGANKTVVGANTLAQAGNQTPLLDAGFAFTAGQIVQVTAGALAGATAVVISLVAGTQFRTTKWRNAAGTIVNTVPANNDTVAVLTLPTVARACLGMTKQNSFVINLDFTAWDARIGHTLLINACRFPTFTQAAGIYSCSGCAIVGSTYTINNAQALGSFNGCGFVLTGGIVITTLGVLSLSQSVISTTSAAGVALDVNTAGTVSMGNLGIFSTGTGATLDVHDNGFVDLITGALYGTSTTPAFGTRVRDGGTMLCVTASTPTLTTTAGGGVELEIDGLGTILPPLISTAGAITSTLTACAAWATWAANPFNRTYLGMGTTNAAATTKASGTRVGTHA